jgi:hypothetical protein
MSKKEEVFELPEKSDDAMDIPVEKLKAPRKKREMSDENKAKMLANLAKGREARKAKAELAKSAKAEPAKVEPLIGVGQSPPQSATPTVSGRTQISERSEANQIVEEKPKAKRTPKPKEEPKVDLNAERERLALINKMVGKEKTNPKPRAEPKLSDTTKETIKAERVKTVEEPKPAKAVEAPKPVAPVVPSKPEIVHVVKRNFSKPIW